MRYTELYETPQTNLKKLERKYGERLLYKIANHDKPFWSKVQRYFQYDISQWADNNGRWTQEALDYIVPWLIGIIAQFDPTDKKIYVPWIVKSYAAALGSGMRIQTQHNPGINYWEDMSRVMRALVLFDANKHRLHMKDINMFTSLVQLEDAVEKFNASRIQIPKNLTRDLLVNKEVEILYQSADYSIVKPKSLRASIFYGLQTRWCTAQTNEFVDKDGKLLYPNLNPFGEMGKVRTVHDLMKYLSYIDFVPDRPHKMLTHPFLDHYKEHDFYIVIDHKKYKKYQFDLLFGDLGDCMDASDRNYSFLHLMLEYPKVIDVINSEGNGVEGILNIIDYNNGKRFLKKLKQLHPHYFENLEWDHIDDFEKDSI